MSHRFEDGIIMDNSVVIIDEKKPGFPITARLFQLLAIIVGSWSSISVLIESLTVPVNFTYIHVAVFLIAGILFLLCLHPSYDGIKLFFGALFYGLFFYSRLPRIQNGFYILENLVLSRMSDYYGLQSLKYKADYSVATADTTLFMILVLIPVVALLSVAIIRNRCVNLCSLILLLPVSCSFLLGIIPSERYLIAYAISVLYLTHSGYYLHHTLNQEQKTLLHRINSRAAVWLSLMGAALFLLMKIVVTPQEYEEFGKIKEIKTDMQSVLFNLTIEDFTNQLSDFHFPGRSVSVGGLSGGELGKTGQVKYTDTEHLRVTAPLTSITEGIYLKGYVGSVYTGDKWEGHSKSTTKLYQDLWKKISIEKFTPVNQVSMLLNRFKNKEVEADKGVNASKFHYYFGKMNIEYMAANEKYLYAPYFTDYDPLDQLKYLQDLYAAPTEKKNQYELNYYFDIALGSSAYTSYSNLMQGDLGEYTTNEKLYRNYVHQVYTQMPKTGLERLKQDFGSLKAKTAMIGITEQIEYVKNYLQQNTQYSLSPGKLPEGKDYVEYFLYENKTGYCAHYASAATLMLRAMGIPARYVEGYAVTSSDVIQSQTDNTQDVTYWSENGSSVNNVVQTVISVRDYNAHAWVEVYVDGCGWIPVEFTPGSAVEYNNTVVKDMATIGENMNRQEEELENKAAVLEEPLPTPVIPKDIAETTPNKEDTTQTKSDASKEQKQQADGWFFAIVIILLIMVSSAALFFRRKKIRRIKNTKNRNRKALYLFAQIEKVLITCHGLPKQVRLEEGEEYIRQHCPYITSESFSDLMETVRKARFGRGRITSQELQSVELFHQSLYSEVYNKQSIGKKVYLKFILFV